MFYSTSIPSNDIVENLRNEDPVEICARNLRTECENYDFLLDSCYRDSNDIKLSIKYLRRIDWRHGNNYLMRSFPVTRIQKKLKWVVT